MLADYEKHLLVEGIELNGAVNEALRKSGLALGAITLLDVNDQQLARLKELSESEPTDALVQAVYGVYTGDFSASLKLLLDDGTPSPTYVRGNANYPAVHWLRAAKVVLDRYGLGE